MSQLAVLGGPPAFAERVPFARPPVPPLADVVARLEKSYGRAVLTNGALVRELEARVADRLGVAHVVAVSSCTAGLMLLFRALVPGGAVVLPSFTFSASAHALAWNGLTPRFVDCDEASCQIDLDALGRGLDGAQAILATHVFGAPCAAEKIEALAREAAIPVVFDAAHALGAHHRGSPVGRFGDGEVFSMSPTKLVIAGEGGLVATNRDDVAASVRIGRDYANPGNYDTQFVGMNARLSELHAAVALASLDGLDEHLARRASIAARYTSGLDGIPGITVQDVATEDSSTYKDFTIQVYADRFGVTRDVLVRALSAEGVDTRNYFDPPVHRQRAYAEVRTPSLPATDRVASRVVSLPIYPSLDDRTIDRIATVVADVHIQARALAASREGG